MDVGPNICTTFSSDFLTTKVVDFLGSLPIYAHPENSNLEWYGFLGGGQLIDFYCIRLLGYLGPKPEYLYHIKLVLGLIFDIRTSRKLQLRMVRFSRRGAVSHQST
jgi:hypothetical protein